MRARYGRARKAEKGRILAECCATTGSHRKAAIRRLPAPTGEAIVWPPIEAIARGSDAERAQWRPRWLQIADDLLARSRQEARAGAKIIAWASWIASRA